VRLTEYAQDIGTIIGALREALLLLQKQGRITARKMNYPAHISESWEISFLQQERI
jgi:hypothetical protein